MLNGLDLFSGIGGIGVALSPWVRTVAYCERERYAQGVLLSRMRSGDIDRAPIWDDVQTLRREMLPSVDIIFGGFPCQDISVAGNGAGLEGKRSGLFFDVVRLVSEIRPRFVFLENVPAISVRGLDRVLLEFTALGYYTRWTTVSAAEVGAPHLRERWFLLAHSDGGGIREREQRHSGRGNALRESEESVSKYDGENASDPESIGRRQGRTESGPTWRTESSKSRGKFPDTASAGLERWRDAAAAWEAFSLGGGGGGVAWPDWFPQPALCRGDDGLSNRVDRLRGLGNAVVPIQAREAFKRLLGIEGVT